MAVSDPADAFDDVAAIASVTPENTIGFVVTKEVLNNDLLAAVLVVAKLGQAVDSYKIRLVLEAFSTQNS